VQTIDETTLTVAGPPAPKRPRRRWPLAVAAVAVAGIAFLVGAEMGGSGEASSSETDAPASAEAAPAVPAVAPVEETPVIGALYDASPVAGAVVPSVVTVEVGIPAAGGFRSAGSGSGVVFDGDGRIVTNDHVIAVGSDYRVVLADGRIYEAELIGSDPRTDLAVLDIDAGGLLPIELGSSESLDVGDPTIAVGSPLGLEGGPSLTVGVLSAFGRQVQTDATTFLVGMLQTDAPITQGSSGGALVDEQGRLVGITTAVGVSDVGIEGIGFATPIEIVTRVVGEIIEIGAATDPYMGVTGGTELADTGDGGLRPVGVLVDSVQPGRAAEAAGIESGDLITAFDGIAVDTMDELIASLRRFGTGDTVELTIVRDGVEQSIEVQLGER
jgi:putative serine protease PepD